MSRPLIEVLFPNVAQQIHQQLKDQGQGVKVLQAAIIGEHTAAWYRYLAGKQSPTVDKVQGWVDDAATRGFRLKVEIKPPPAENAGLRF